MFQSSLGPQAERYFAVDGRAPTQVFQSSPSASFSPLAILPRRPYLSHNASFRSHRGQSFGVLTALVFHLRLSILSRGRPPRPSLGIGPDISQFHFGKVLRKVTLFRFSQNSAFSTG